MGGEYMSLSKIFVASVLMLLISCLSFGGNKSVGDDVVDSLRSLIVQYEDALEAPYLTDEVRSVEHFEEIDKIKSDIARDRGFLDKIRSDIRVLEGVDSAMMDVVYSNSSLVGDIDSCDIYSIWMSVSFQLRTLNEMKQCIESSCGGYESYLSKLSSNAGRGKRKIAECDINGDGLK